MGLVRSNEGQNRRKRLILSWNMQILPDYLKLECWSFPDFRFKLKPGLFLDLEVPAFILEFILWALPVLRPLESN